MWTKLVEGNDWMSLYYAPEGKHLTASGCASRHLGIKLEHGQPMRVRFPDGTEQTAKLVATDVSGTYGDMGHTYEYSTQRFGVECDVHGGKAVLPLTQVEVWLP